MKLDSKKKLAARTLNVGIGRISFNTNRLEEIKEAITKQDIKDLFSNGAIIIKPIKGKRKLIIKRKRRGKGKVKKIINDRKRKYVIITRKLRRYLKEMKKQEKIDNDAYKILMKKVKNRSFKSKSQLKESIQ